MSIAAQKWALRQELGPVPKFVLVVLAEAGNAEGICWPRVSTIAERVGVSTRTVQRAIQYLVRQKLVTVEPQLRPDGSSTSNRYRLSLTEGGDKLTPLPDKLTPSPGTRVTQGCHPCHRGGDTGVTPLTTRRTTKEPPPQEGISEVDPQPQPTRRGGGRNGNGKKLESEIGIRAEEAGTRVHLPEKLLPGERALAEKTIGALDAPLDQQVLDEWAAIIAAGDIRASPLGCLRALVDRARAGKFTPERGLYIAQARAARQRVKTRVEKPPGLAPANPDSRLVQRLQQMAQRQGRDPP